MSDDRVREIQQRVEKATGGKWWWQILHGRRTSLIATRIVGHPTVIKATNFETLEISDPDCAFISHAREDVEYLVSRLQAAEQQISEMVEAGRKMELDYVRQLANRANDLDAAEARIQSLTEAQRWIPVSEKLPEDCGAVYCWSERRGERFVGWFSTAKSEWYQKSQGSTFDPEVTHWRPLPEPPVAHNEGETK